MAPEYDEGVASDAEITEKDKRNAEIFRNLTFDQ